MFCLFATYTLLLLLVVVTNQPSTLRDSFTLRYAGLGVRLHGKKLIPYYSAFQSFFPPSSSILLASMAARR